MRLFSVFLSIILSFVFTTSQLQCEQFCEKGKSKRYYIKDTSNIKYCNGHFYILIRKIGNDGKTWIGIYVKSLRASNKGIYFFRSDIIKNNRKFSSEKT